MVYVWLHKSWFLFLWGSKSRRTKCLSYTQMRHERKETIFYSVLYSSVQVSIRIYIQLHSFLFYSFLFICVVFRSISFFRFCSFLLVFSLACGTWSQWGVSEAQPVAPVANVANVANELASEHRVAGPPGAQADGLLLLLYEPPGLRAPFLRAPVRPSLRAECDACWAVAGQCC